MPPVASAPALQCVSMRAPSGMSGAPCSPIAPAHRAIFVENSRRFDAQRVAQVACRLSRLSLGDRAAFDRPPTRGSRRSDASRECARARVATSRCDASRATAPSHRRARATSPIAPAMPIAGAPRTASVRDRVAHVVDGAQLALHLSRRQQALVEDAHAASAVDSRPADRFESMRHRERSEGSAAAEST